MAIWNLGSINIDMVYRVLEFPAPGQTLAADEVTRGLGGKGANMSVAAARAAARVNHIGAIGADGAWARDLMMEFGVDISHIATLPSETGHAIILLNSEGENSIVLYPGANRNIAEDGVAAALSAAHTGDTLLLQNETNGQEAAAKMGRQLGLQVVYAAAPFDAEAVRAVLPYIDFLILNEGEAADLVSEMGTELGNLPVGEILVTLGAEGCVYYDNTIKVCTAYPALEVDVVDTTGAGDVFTGYLVAARDRGLPMAQAIDLATTAAALMVTRLGTAEVIPDLKDIEDFKLRGLS